MIQWTSRLEVGHALIDLDHYRLVRDTNCLVGYLVDGIARSRDDAAIALALGRLIQDTKAHFMAEERLMEGLLYSEATAHKSAHRHLIRSIEALRLDIGSGRRVPDSHAICFVENWLLDHILTTDRKLSAFLNSRPSQREPDA